MAAQRPGEAEKERSTEGSLERIRCRVCAEGIARLFWSGDERAYYRCGRCAATFVDASHLPSAAAEVEHYRLHENSVDDPGYRRFLGKLAEPLLRRLAPALEGLDYGCGPGPALSAMLSEAGHTMHLYDPFFCPDPAPLKRTYDFITCTEVAEHFHRPWEEFVRLGCLLRPGGLLAIMTCFQTDDSRFADWFYRRDPTHVVFYRAETFFVLAERLGWRCEVPVKDVALMYKGKDSRSGSNRPCGSLHLSTCGRLHE